MGREIYLEDKLHILLVEDDIESCQKFEDCIEDEQGMSLVGTCNNVIEAINCIQDCLPHVLILDLELHFGGGNGLLLLKNLKQLNLDYRPYILITTNNTSSITYEIARKLGADFIMGKFQSDYSAKSVIEFLQLMSESIFTNFVNNSNKKNVDIKDKANLYQHLKRKICIELNKVGVSPKAIGYNYLIDAILLIYKNPQTNICSILGTKYSKTDSSIERAMQNAINKAWRTSDIDTLSTCYTARISSERGVPTLNEFIFYYANKIKNCY